LQVRFVSIGYRISCQIPMCPGNSSPCLLSPPVQYWPYRAKRGRGNANADHGCCGCCWGACGHDRSRLTGGIRMPSHITDSPFVRKAQRAFYKWRPARLTKAPSRFTAFTTNTSLIKERERALLPLCPSAWALIVSIHARGCRE